MAASYDYPVAVEGEYQERINRFLWLIKWILAIPNWFVLLIFSIPSIVTYPAAWLIIIITGRYPRWLWDYHFGLLRWGWRLNFYAYQMGGTDRYPPFSLGDQDYPASITIEYPLTSSRLTVLFRWILVIPHWIIVSIISEVVSILVLIALVVVLITGAYPRTLFDFNLGLNRWRYRVSAYGGFLRDEYPPFGIDP